MRVLVELDRRGTLGAVAEATGYSKSAVSQQLAALQRAVGVPLAERVGRRLRLMPAGMALLPSANQILASVEAARGTLNPEAEPVGNVRVAAFASMLTGPVLRAIHELSARHPRLAISLQEREPREVDTMAATRGRRGSSAASRPSGSRILVAATTTNCFTGSPPPTEPPPVWPTASTALG